MPRVCYVCLLTLLWPFLFLRLGWRGRRAPAYRQRWRERAGRAQPPAPTTRPIWIHAVSVGETLAAQPLVAAVQARWPDVPLLITTMTPTGSDQVRRIWGDRVHHVYAPWDAPWAVARFLRHWRPRLLVVMETELWPNLLHQTRASGCPVVLANARLSSRSAKGYARGGGLTRTIISALSRVAAQDEATAARFRGLGVPADRIAVTGSVKFDLQPPTDLPVRVAAFRATGAWSDRPIWVAASTHAGEEAEALRAHAQLRLTWPRAVLILVPRHPERFASVAALLADHPEAGQGIRRSSGQPLADETSVLLADSMGELLLWLGVAAAAPQSACWVGGSWFAPGGGHNTLEPALLGVSTFTGPFDANFLTINDQLRAAGGLKTVTDATALAEALMALWADPARAAAQVSAAQQVVQMHRGAVARHVVCLEALL